MKDWKFIQVGNMKTDAKAKELFEKMMDAKEIAENWGRMSSYHKEDISSGLKVAKDAYLKAKREYEEYANSDEHVKNESIDKQTWSMFKGLTKKAESEVGNDESDLIKRGFVYKVIIPGKKPIYFNNPRQAQISAEAQKGTVEKVGNEKVGNALPHQIADILEKELEYLKKGRGNYAVYEAADKLEKIGVPSNEARKYAEDPKRWLRNIYEQRDLGNKVGNYKTGKSKLKQGDRVSSYGVKGTVKSIKGENVDNIYGEPLIEIEFDDGTVKTIGEHYVVKVSNARPKEQLLADVRELTKYIKEHPGQDCEKEKRLLGQAKEELDKYYGVIVGNTQIAGDFYDIVMSGSHFYIYKNGGSQIIGPFNSEQEAQKKIDAIKKERNRIGNETIGQWAKAKPRVINDESTEIRDDYNREIYRLERKRDELERKGQGYEARKVREEIRKLERELRELGNKKIGNAGQWNSTKTIYGKWDDKAGRPAEEYARITWLGQGKGGLVNIWRGNQMTSEKYGSNDLEDLRRWAEQRIGNETKGERKFGKVMGEFERGELKSGSGEKVTDPAQAKAIAYSEADKVDNLKRARNAMAKNKQITLWDGNDSVLISEDGTVQYLESNSFEVDRDKYDSQQKAVEELTKQGYRKK